MSCSGGGRRAAALVVVAICSIYALSPLQASAPSNVAALHTSNSSLAAQILEWAELRSEMPQWMEAHQSHRRRAEEYRQSGGLDGGLVWYGDSITESLLGLAMGHPMPRTLGIDAVFDKYWRSRFKTDVFAISGDRTGHLAWRLMHGEGATGLSPKVAVLMIGTNDIGWTSREVADAGEAGNIIAGRVQQIVRLLLEQEPGLHVVLQGLLPIGGTQDMFARTKPYLSELNSRLEEFAADPGIAPRVTYVYCGDALLAEGGGWADEEVMPDGLHPNPQGWTRLSECLQPVILPLMGSKA